MIDIRDIVPAEHKPVFMEIYGNSDVELNEQVSTIDKAMRAAGYHQQAYSAHVGKIQLVYLTEAEYQKVYKDFLDSDRNSLGHLYFGG